MINDLYTYITIPSVFLKIGCMFNCRIVKGKSSLPQAEKKKKKGVEGLGVKALAMCRKSRLLILPF